MGVVWCRNRVNYNKCRICQGILQLWFDVEIEWITTFSLLLILSLWLWFDVEIEWITTVDILTLATEQLWFDVEIEWITTDRIRYSSVVGLWFDVEIEWITTAIAKRTSPLRLWFDVESLWILSNYSTYILIQSTIVYLLCSSKSIYCTRFNAWNKNTRHRFSAFIALNCGCYW